jgi:hypothetical protein
VSRDGVPALARNALGGAESGKGLLKKAAKPRQGAQNDGGFAIAQLMGAISGA